MVRYGVIHVIRCSGPCDTALITQSLQDWENPYHRRHESCASRPVNIGSYARYKGVTDNEVRSIPTVSGCGANQGSQLLHIHITSPRSSPTRKIHGTSMSRQECKLASSYKSYVRCYPRSPPRFKIDIFSTPILGFKKVEDSEHGNDRRPY